MVMSGRGGDTERPYTGNWMNNTRAWLVGRNLPATHAAEINAIVEELAQRGDVDPARISVRASGVAGIPALLAAAVNPRISSVMLTRTPHSVRAAIDSPIHTNLHDAVIPGFAVKWDLTDLRDLLRPRRSTGGIPPTGWGTWLRSGDAYTYSSSDPNVIANPMSRSVCRAGRRPADPATRGHRDRTGGSATTISPMTSRSFAFLARLWVALAAAVP